MEEQQWITQEEIGQRVRVLRQARGFSQERLAHEAAQSRRWPRPWACP